MTMAEQQEDRAEQEKESRPEPLVRPYHNQASLQILFNVPCKNGLQEREAWTQNSVAERTCYKAHLS